MNEDEWDAGDEYDPMETHRGEILKGRTPRGVKSPTQTFAALLRNPNEEAAFRKKIAKRLKKKRKAS